MRYRFCLIIILFIVASCKKENSSVSNLLTGSWELRTIYNGQGGKTDYPPNNGNDLVFTSTTYKVLKNGNVLRTGSYTIIKDTFSLTAQIGNRIIYDGTTDTPRTFVEISGEKLGLRIDAYDAPASEYVRK